MFQDFVNEKDVIASPCKFNPTLIKDDHKGNMNGIEATYGKLESHTSSCLYHYEKEFLESRTSCCLYYFDKSMKKHVGYILKEHQDVYYMLLNDFLLIKTY